MNNSYLTIILVTTTFNTWGRSGRKVYIVPLINPPNYRLYAPLQRMRVLFLKENIGSKKIIASMFASSCVLSSMRYNCSPRLYPHALGRGSFCMYPVPAFFLNFLITVALKVQDKAWNVLPIRFFMYLLRIFVSGGRHANMRGKAALRSP